MFDYARIASSINLGLVVVDRDLRVLACNRWLALHSGISEAGIGSGLGLFISRRSAQAHGGNVRFVAVQPGITVFEIVIPGLH